MANSLNLKNSLFPLFMFMGFGKKKCPKSQLSPYPCTQKYIHWQHRTENTPERCFQLNLRTMCEMC